MSTRVLPPFGSFTGWPGTYWIEQANGITLSRAHTIEKMILFSTKLNSSLEKLAKIETSLFRFIDQNIEYFQKNQIVFRFHEMTGVEMNDPKNKIQLLPKSRIECLEDILEKSKNLILEHLSIWREIGILRAINHIHKFNILPREIELNKK